jgi:hypothetical protein
VGSGAVSCPQAQAIRYGGSSIGRILLGFLPITILITVGFGTSDAGIVLRDDGNPSAVSASTKADAAPLVCVSAVSEICSSTPTTKFRWPAPLRPAAVSQPCMSQARIHNHRCWGSCCCVPTRTARAALGHNGALVTEVFLSYPPGRTGVAKSPQVIVPRQGGGG